MLIFLALARLDRPLEQAAICWRPVTSRRVKIWEPTQVSPLTSKNQVTFAIALSNVPGQVGDECSVEKVEKATGLSFDDIDVALGQKLMILSSYGARNGSGTFTRYE